mgnify:CR=1 FL=1
MSKDLAQNGRDLKTGGAWQCVLSAIGAVALSTALMLLLGSRVPSDAQAAMPHVTDSGGESFIYRFDPATSSFTFTFTIPTENANPWDVVVAGRDQFDVWFTQSGIDRIGRLTYTDTQDYAFREYTLTVGSQPLNLELGKEFVWFTAAGGDYIGRLDPTTGQVDEFDVAAGSYPADLDIAPDGSIWFTEMATDRLARMTVTSTYEYGITEYASPVTAAGRGWPYGVVVVGDSVYFAHPRVLTDCVTRFTPPDSWIDITGFVGGIPDGPFKLTVNSRGQVWGTERAGNRISSFGYGTMPIVTPYSLVPADSMPAGLAADADDHLWFTQRRMGQIGRLTPNGDPQKDYYTLPLDGLEPTGVAVDGGGGIWVLAQRPHRVYLPVVVRFL